MDNLDEWEEELEEAAAAMEILMYVCMHIQGQRLVHMAQIFFWGGGREINRKRFV